MENYGSLCQATGEITQRCPSVTFESPGIQMSRNDPILNLARFINAVDSLGLSVKEAVAATSTRPAKRIGLKDRGEIAVGMRADLLSYNAATSSVTLISE